MKPFIILDAEDNIHAVKWDVEQLGKAIVIIVHGMAEHIDRYDAFASFLNSQGIIVYGYEVLGHGRNVTKQNQLGHWNKGDFKKNVDNIATLIRYAKKEHPNKKVFLLGHSMGSFLAKQYIVTYGVTIDGVILSGSTATNTITKIGSWIAKGFRKKHDREPNLTMMKLSFGNYNQSFQPNKTEYDWLSSDEKEVQKYIDDPLCGFPCTGGYFKELTRSLHHLDDHKKLKQIPKTLPILLIAGSLDPVSSNTKGVKTLYRKYEKSQIEDLKMLLYEGKRHELLNEVNKEDVMHDILGWLEHYID